MSSFVYVWIDNEVIYVTKHFVVLPCFCRLVCLSIVNISDRNIAAMKQLIIPMVLFLSFEFLLSVVTVYLPCKKRRYFKLQIIWTRLIIFFCKCYLVLSIHFSYRFNCCAGYILDINKSICVGKYTFYFNTMQFKNNTSSTSLCISTFRVFSWIYWSPLPDNVSFSLIWNFL